MITQDNVLGKNLWTQLTMIVETLPWQLTQDTAWGTDSRVEDNFSFHHLARSNDQPTSQYHDIADLVVRALLDNANIRCNQIVKIRFGLYTNIGHYKIHDPHVDLKYPHSTGLLYLNDSDGDTIIYNERYDYNSNMDPNDFYKAKLQSKVTVYSRVEPKKNRLLVFDGSIYHSSSSPQKHSQRSVLAFCFN